LQPCQHALNIDVRPGPSDKGHQSSPWVNFDESRAAIKTPNQVHQVTQ